MESKPATTSLPLRSSAFIADCLCIWLAEVFSQTGDLTYFRSEILDDLKELSGPLARKSNHSPITLLSNWSILDTVNLNAREKDLPFNLFQIAVLEPAARVIAFNKETLNVNLKGHDEEYLRKLEFFVDTAFPTPQDWWASRQQYLISNVTNDDSERVDYTPDLSDQKIPASDRFVVATDNQEALDEAQQALSVLKEAIEDNRDNDFDDKEEILCDLAVLEATFNQPLINTTLVESIFSTTIRYLTIKFADNAIGIASNALILATAKFIGLV